MRAPGRRRVGALALVLVAVVALPWVLDRRFPLNLERARALSVQVLDAEGAMLRGFTTAEGTWRFPLDPEEVDPRYLQMLVAFEDHRFHAHPGIDPLAMARALWQWMREGTVVSGASTLTMQVARLLEPRPRTLKAKLIEMLRALQLEWHMGKRRILGLYLTLAPYGGNLEGLRSASLAYLGREPRRLGLDEAALLVVLPQAPSRLRPDRYPEAARAARDKVLERMVRRGHLTPEEATAARAAPVPTSRRPLPFVAPHLARRLAAARPAATVHRSFIRRDLQERLEALAERTLAGLDPRANLAAVVVENRSRRVTAYLGSAAFFDTARAGQVDLVRAVRSPGSTLKPLVYGMGFDDLLIHPDTLVHDTPTRFGSYGPENFLGRYHGEVTVGEALQRSLNVPAVAVLERVGPRRLATRLAEAGIRLRFPDDDAAAAPSLPLVLGGVGTTLEDLVALYTGLANAGVVAPLRLTPLEPPREGVRVLGEAASWYLERILSDTPPPPGTVAHHHLRLPRPVAYKTGTSYGFRDAWALGFDGDHTVGVWVGRPDGTPSPGRHGRNTAAPVLFRIFDLLPRPRPGAQAPPAGVIAGGRDLPPGLRRLERGGEGPGPRSAAGPIIRFPLDGTTLLLRRRDGGLEPMPLAASGGRRPLRWLVNGAPVSASARGRGASWAPDGEGLARVSVVDARGRTATVEVWIRVREMAP